MYYVLTFLHAVYETIFLVIFKDGNLAVSVVPLIFYVNHIFNMVSILFIATWVIEKKSNIITHLRSMRISEIPAETKLQVKLFMNQISLYEQKELTAFGLFNLNLRLITSMSVLLIMVLSTMIQMKNHPIFNLLHNLLGVQFKINP
uniref:Gustatory receptor n=2 Tax=Sipha flava TaxID=143950 RepID=A0A2S2R402_9HEMI